MFEITVEKKNSIYNNVVMLRKVVPGTQEEVKPDILIPYDVDRERLSETPMSIIYVRPETNRVDYEAAIVKALAPYARVAYMANLTGGLINNRAIIASHYSSQMVFAINGKEEMARYPEMVQKFEEKFKVDFRLAPIVGPFCAIMECKLKKDADELFETMVPEPNFLRMYGQTIKKIGDFYVINYDIPAIITRHHSDTSMFVLAVKLKKKEYRFQDLNRGMYDNMCNGKTTELLGSEKRRELPWYDQIRRTYHISRSHMEAMFDLTDYVFKDDTERILFADTPLGQLLLERGILAPERMEKCLTFLKENPLVYLENGDGKSRLVNIISEGKFIQDGCLIENSMEECSRIIESIDWEKSLEENCRVCTD